MSRRQSSLSKDLMYSLEADGISDRQLLASALESAIDTSTEDGQIELARLREYKESIATLMELEAELEEITANLTDEQRGYVDTKDLTSLMKKLLK